MRDFSGVPSFGFRGQYIQAPVAFDLTPVKVPVSVPLTIDWSIYRNAAIAAGNNGVNVGVDIVLVGNTAGVIIERVRSVKIDNTNSLTPVYVFVPDTGDTISCPPNATLTYPVQTRGYNFKVIAEGLNANNLPLTRVTFYNVALPPALDPEIQTNFPLYKASPTITRGTTIFNQNFGSPALGDQIFSVASNFSTGGILSNVFGSPYSTGFIYITSMFVKAFVPAGAATGLWNVVLESTGISGILFTFGDVAILNQNMAPTAQMSNMNVQLDATQTWQLRCTAAQSVIVIQAHFAFTVNPN